MITLLVHKQKVTPALEIDLTLICKFEYLHIEEFSIIPLLDMYPRERLVPAF